MSRPKNSTRARRPRSRTHEIEIASGRLARQEQQIVREAERALVLLTRRWHNRRLPRSHRAGTRRHASGRRPARSKPRLGIITQGLEEDIIAALEETLAAHCNRRLKEARQQNRSRPSAIRFRRAGPDQNALVDQLAELRMIRALQNRDQSTYQVRYGDIIGDEPAHRTRTCSKHSTN